MNPHTDRFYGALKAEADCQRSLLVWLKDYDKYGNTEEVMELLDDWMVFSRRTIKIAKEFIQDQPVISTIDMDSLDEVML